MYIQGVDNVFDIEYANENNKIVHYSDVHLQGEYEFSKYNFEVADVKTLFSMFSETQEEARRCLEAGLPLPAYDYTMMSSHFFNVLDARKAISVAQRQNYILKIRELAKGCAMLYKEQEEQRNLRLHRG